VHAAIEEHAHDLGRARVLQDVEQRAHVDLAEGAALAAEQEEEAALGLELDGVVDEVEVLVGLEVAAEGVVVLVEAGEDVGVVQAQRGHEWREGTQFAHLTRLKENVRMTVRFMFDSRKSQLVLAQKVCEKLFEENHCFFQRVQGGQRSFSKFFKILFGSFWYRNRHVLDKKIFLGFEFFG
jgi:hypothetical protein